MAIPVPNWDEAPAFGRRETLVAALRRLWELHPGPVTIVETGTLRNASDSGRSGDGWSTVAWGWYSRETGGRAWTVDVSRENLAVCRTVTAPYAEHLEYVEGDSVVFLRAWPGEERGPIHLLYLDSLDYLPHQREASEAHHRSEAEASLPHLAERCLVLLDDTGESGDGFSGKGAQVVPFLLDRGFCLEWSTRGQVLLSQDPARGSPALEPGAREAKDG